MAKRLKKMGEEEVAAAENVLVTDQQLSEWLNLGIGVGRLRDVVSLAIRPTTAKEPCRKARAVTCGGHGDLH